MLISISQYTVYFDLRQQEQNEILFIAVDVQGCYEPLIEWIEFYENVAVNAAIHQSVIITLQVCTVFVSQYTTSQVQFLVFSRQSRLCYSLSAVVVCTRNVVAKRCVLEQKLLLTAYRKSHMRN